MPRSIATLCPVLKAPIKDGPSTSSGRAGDEWIAPPTVHAELVEALPFLFLPATMLSKPRLNHVFAQAFRAAR